MTNSIKVGDKIPAFSIHDDEGIEIDSEDLLGNPFVLYFYPKDDTPGCTIEACSFRDNLPHLDELNILVIGVSPDQAESHIKFRQKFGLNFTLFCDENYELARKFDAVKEKDVAGKKEPSILRSTFFIDSAGIIRWIEKPVSIEGHIERVLKAVQQNIK